MNSAIAFLGGLGLFLTAIKLLAGLPTKVGEVRARMLLAQATRHPLQTALAGSIAGAALQSTSAVTLILARLVGARLIAPVGAMSLIVWANVGSSSLVFLASLKLRLVALLLVGIFGPAFYYARGSYARGLHRPLHLAIEAGLHVGLMLFGLAVMREGAGALKDAPFVAEILGASQPSVSLALLIGFVAALVTQSSSTTTILTLTAVQAHLVGLSDGMVMALGANAASGVNVLLLGADAKRRERQPIVFQAVAKAVGVIAVLPVLLVDRWHPALGFEHALQRLVGDPGPAISLVFLLCQIVSLGVFYGAKDWIASHAAPSIATPLEEAPRCQEA